MKQKRSKIRPKENINIEWLESKYLFKLFKKILLFENPNFQQLREPPLADTTIGNALGILRSVGVISIQKNPNDNRKKIYKVNDEGVYNGWISFLEERWKENTAIFNIKDLKNKENIEAVKVVFWLIFNLKNNSYFQTFGEVYVAITTAYLIEISQKK
jgi:hypothetical protein